MAPERFPPDPAHRARGHGLGLALIAAAAGLLAVAALLWWVNTSIGPATRWVNVRWRPDVDVSRRAEAERALGLQGGVGMGGRTWTYTLRDRSRAGVGAIVGSPLVEDTYHLDLVRQRIEVDPPDPGHIRHPAERAVLRLPWLLPLLQADLMAHAAATFGIVALILLAAARRSLVWLLRWSGVAAVAALPAAGHRGALVRDAVDRRLGYDREARGGPSPAEYLAGIALSLLFLAPLLVYGPYEEEVMQHSVFPNQMFYRALFRGEWLYWLNDLGFGTPLPGDLLMFHPIAGPLLALSTARVALSALWIAHTALAAVYVLRLTALSHVRSTFLRLFLLAGYLWSGPGIVYYYDTDWITNAIAWSLYPVLVYHLYAAVRAPAPGRLAAVAGLAVLFSFWILNAHPGYVAPLLAVLVVYTVAAAPPRPRVYAALTAAAVLCTAATSAHLYALAHEARLFDVSTFFDRSGATLTWYAQSPFWIAPGDRRGPLIGFAIVASAAAALLLRSTWRDAHLRACAVAFVAAVGLSLLPPRIVQWLAPSGSLLFRDPYTFFGLLLAGTMLQRWLDHGVRPLVVLLVTCQVVQQGITFVGPALQDFLDHKDSLLFYRYQDQAVGIGRDLVEASRRFGRRVYLSPQVDETMRGMLSHSGVHFSSDLALIGLNPVNGWFKNVAMGAVHPPDSMMESYIHGDRHVIANGPLLDVLGIDLVLMSGGEGPPPPGLVPVTTRKMVQARDTIEGDLILVANPDAWPKAVLLDSAAAALTLPVSAGCAHTAALCRDYEPMRPHRLPDGVSLREHDGQFEASFTPAPAARLLFISSLYRPEWEATSADGTRLEVRPVAGAFIGVAVPPGSGGVTLTYRPRVLQAFTWFSSLTFSGLCVAWVVSRRRESRRRS